MTTEANVTHEIEFEYNSNHVRHVKFKHPFFWADVAVVHSTHDWEDPRKRTYHVSFGFGGELVDNNIACARIKAIAIMNAAEFADKLNASNGIWKTDAI